MANKHKLTAVALGITTKCSHRCDICYETANLERRERHDGDLKTLFHIGDKLVKAGVEDVELVGGDPAEYARIGVLTHYLKDSGLNVHILSNTHFSWQDYAPYVSSLEWTVHGQRPYHDAYTLHGAYKETLRRLQAFADTKRADQQIGITINFTPVIAVSLYDTICELADELPIDYIQLQRVGPFGGAADGAYTLELDDVIRVFEQVQMIDQKWGIEIEVVDSFPMCLLPEDLRKYTARCDWGYGTAYVDMKGNLSRCAVNQIPIGNILDPGLPLKQLWEQHPDLRRFREKKYLLQTCQQGCDMLEECGGGCPVSCGGCDLSSDELMIRANMFK